MCCCCCNWASINHDSYLHCCPQKKHSPSSESVFFLSRFSGRTCHNMFPHNLDKPVPITPCLFMDETQRMVHFMLNCSFIHAPIFHQAHCLTSSNFPKVRPAAKNRQSITKMITFSTYKEMDVLIMPPRAFRCAAMEGAMQTVTGVRYLVFQKLPNSIGVEIKPLKLYLNDIWYHIYMQDIWYDKWSSLSS